MKVRGSCTLYQDVEINESVVIKELKKKYLSSLNIKKVFPFSSSLYIDSRSSWIEESNDGHGSPDVEIHRKSNTRRRRNDEMF